MEDTDTEYLTIGIDVAESGDGVETVKLDSSPHAGWHICTGDCE